MRSGDTLGFQIFTVHSSIPTFHTKKTVSKGQDHVANRDSTERANHRLESLIRDQPGRSKMQKTQGLKQLSFVDLAGTAQGSL